MHHWKPETYWPCWARQLHCRIVSNIECKLYWTSSLKSNWNESNQIQTESNCSQIKESSPYKKENTIIIFFFSFFIFLIIFIYIYIYFILTSSLLFFEIEIVNCFEIYKYILSINYLAMQVNQHKKNTRTLREILD